jgi:hypothetical protein
MKEYRKKLTTNKLTQSEQIIIIIKVMLEKYFSLFIKK